MPTAPRSLLPAAIGLALAAIVDVAAPPPSATGEEARGTACRLSAALHAAPPSLPVAPAAALREPAAITPRVVAAGG